MWNSFTFTHAFYSGVHFVVAILCLNSSISVISWRWYDAWDEEEKARASDSTRLNLRHFYHCMRGIGLLRCYGLYAARKLIAAQLNVMAVTRFVSLSPRSTTLCLNQLSYLPHPTTKICGVHWVTSSVYVLLGGRYWVVNIGWQVVHIGWQVVHIGWHVIKLCV